MGVKLIQNKFLAAVALKYGVMTYGALSTAACIYYCVEPTLTFQDWLVFVGIVCPATTFFGLIIYDSSNFAYAWANWYFSFFACGMATVYVIL